MGNLQIMTDPQQTFQVFVRTYVHSEAGEDVLSMQVFFILSRVISFDRG